MSDLWLAASAATAAAVVLVVMLLRRRRRPAELDWPRLLADTDYYRRVLAHLFSTQGFQVRGYRVFKDPLEEQPREILFSLRKEGTLYAALCVRWIVLVTSDVVGHFEAALAATRADVGMIVTTSHFSDAALERARHLPVELHDRDHLQRWIRQVWPNALMD